MFLKRKISIPGLILLALLLCGGWLVHKFYVSLSEISYNKDSERFEVSIRMFPDDLDRALLERNGISTQLGTEFEHRSADSLLKLYLLGGFSLRVDGKELELIYLGKEPESDALWCYLESVKVPDPEVMTVRNSILTEYFPDQVNIIQVYHGKWNKGILLNLNNTEGTIRIGE